jgi:isoleucyl-tRNA synthetase
LYTENPKYKDLDKSLLENIAIISELEIFNEHSTNECFIPENNKDIGVVVSKVSGNKCDRCWKYFPIVENLVCKRCSEAI